MWGRFRLQIVGSNQQEIVRSQDVIFFEDETIEDIVKPKKQISTPQVIDMDPVPSPIFWTGVPSPIVHGNHGGDDSIEDASPAQDDD